MGGRGGDGVVADLPGLEDRGAEGRRFRVRMGRYEGVDAEGAGGLFEALVLAFGDFVKCEEGGGRSIGGHGNEHEADFFLMGLN